MSVYPLRQAQGPELLTNYRGKLTEHEVPEGSSQGSLKPKIATALYRSGPAINNFAG
jgi:hypothetical protein